MSKCAVPLFHLSPVSGNVNFVTYMRRQRRNQSMQCCQTCQLHKTFSGVIYAAIGILPLVSTKFMTLGVKITPKTFHEIGHWSNFAQIFFIFCCISLELRFYVYPFAKPLRLKLRAKQTLSSF